MPRNEGNAGVGARHYGDELAVLRGRLTTDEGAVYPRDECLECVREGKPDSEPCFHRHRETTDQVAAYTRRD